MKSIAQQIYETTRLAEPPAWADLTPEAQQRFRERAAPFAGVSNWSDPESDPIADITAKVELFAQELLFALKMVLREFEHEKTAATTHAARLLRRIKG